MAAKTRQRPPTLIAKEQWFENYINPFVLLNPGSGVSLESLDVKAIQRLKKDLLQEVELEQGHVSWFPHLRLDRSQVLSACEQLTDEVQRSHHWVIFNDKPLLDFLSTGAHAHFLVTEDDPRLPILRYQEDRENGFLDWLTPKFAPQFDKVLSKAIDASEISILECLLDGRRWVPHHLQDQCFRNTRRTVDRLLQPLRDAADRAEAEKPSIAAVQDLLISKSVRDVMNLLPSFFEEFQNEAVHAIRSIAISSFNAHDDIELSRGIIELARQFHFRSADANRAIEADVEQIEKLLKRERQHDAKLTSGGKAWEVTKEGARLGDKRLSVSEVASVCWGVLLSGDREAPMHEYLVSINGHRGSFINFEWKSQTDVDKNMEHFKQLMKAVLTYIVPSLVDRAEALMKQGGRVGIGPCTLSAEGIRFNVKGWVFSSEHFLPWVHARTKLSSGELVVTDARNPSKQVSFPLRSTANAPLIPLLVANRRN